MATNRSSPMKVPESAYQKVRLISAVTGKSQAEIAAEAVNEYVTRHAEDFALALKEARQKLFEGEAEAVAYLLDEDPKDVKRISTSND